MATKTMDLGQVMGTSAYQEAQAGGYTGTQEEFQAQLAAIANKAETFVVTFSDLVEGSGKDGVLAVFTGTADHTAAEIFQAANAGKIVIGAMMQSGLTIYYKLTEVASSLAAFVSFVEGIVLYATVQDNSANIVEFQSTRLTSNVIPSAPGDAAVGTSSLAARADHVHPKEVSDADRATWNSSVRYDAAQSLSDAQKDQARGNIDAAPGGFGLGGNSKMLTPSDNLDTLMQNGWFQYNENNPPKGTLPTALSPYASLIHVSVAGITCVQEAYDVTDSAFHGTVLRRTVYGLGAGAKIYPWEYENPPMKLGVEYRTTERYNGKAVYAKMVDCGVVPSVGSYKTVEISGANIRSVEAYSPMRGNTLPFYGADGLELAIQGGFGNILIRNYSHGSSDTNIYATIKYTKDTD